MDNEITDQSQYCLLAMQRIRKKVLDHLRLKTNGYYRNNHYALKRDITALRQELNVLSQMIN